MIGEVVPGSEAARPGDRAEPGISGVLEVAAFLVDCPAIGAGGPQGCAFAADDVDQTARFQPHVIPPDLAAFAAPDAQVQIDLRGVKTVERDVDPLPVLGLVDLRLVVVQRRAVLGQHGDADLVGGLEILRLDGDRDVVITERLRGECLAGPAVAMLRVVQADVLHPQRSPALRPHGRVDEGDLARLVHEAPAGGDVVFRLLEAAIDEVGRIVSRDEPSVFRHEGSVHHGQALG